MLCKPGGQKNLYIELLIKESATREEIRAAYWQRAKEIHPDKASGDEQADAAEGSMSRLNEIMAVLGDDNKRSEYDAELKRQRVSEQADLRNVSAAALQAWKMSERGAVFQSLWPARLWFAALACAVAACALAVLMSDSREAQWWQTHVSGAPSPSAVPIPRKPAQPELKPMQPAQVPHLPATEPKMRTFAVSVSNVGNDAESPLVQEARRALESPIARPIGTAQSPIRLLPKPAPEIAAAIPANQREGLSQPARAANLTWNGEWKYMETLGGGVGGTFNALSIEMRLSSSGRKVLGVYKARYKVTRKYLDTVQFSFEAWSDSSEQLRGAWEDPSGARGEFELKKVDDKVVEMHWWTTAFARKRTLASGMARLLETSR